MSELQVLEVLEREPRRLVIGVKTLHVDAYVESSKAFVLALFVDGDVPRDPLLRSIHAAMHGDPPYSPEGTAPDYYRVAELAEELIETVEVHNPWAEPGTEQSPPQRGAELVVTFRDDRLAAFLSRGTNWLSAAFDPMNQIYSEEIQAMARAARPLWEEYRSYRSPVGGTMRVKVTRLEAPEIDLLVKSGDPDAPHVETPGDALRLILAVPYTWTPPWDEEWAGHPRADRLRRWMDAAHAGQGHEAAFDQLAEDALLRCEIAGGTRPLFRNVRLELDDPQLLAHLRKGLRWQTSLPRNRLGW
jgi:hypothetical protein